MRDSVKLNKEQRKAVLHSEGPALIIAGAGTGKTAVITERIARLIFRGKMMPEEILALTFTEKAAEEMKERVENLLPPSYAYSDLWISTFHAFCDRILRNHGIDIGLPVGFKLAEEISLRILFKRNLESFGLKYYRPAGNPTKFIEAMVSHFLRCKDDMISPDDYLLFAQKAGPDKERILEIANAYHRYQKLMLDNGFMDFGDLICYSIKLFKERPLILNKYRKQFKYILIDEFQDTNRAQYQLIKLLSQPANNIVVCLDDNQAIYRWRGASSGNIAEFQKNHPQAEKIILKKNYRSLQNILDLTHQFMIIGGSEKSERLIAHRKGKGVIEHLHFKTLEQELQGITKKISEITKTGVDFGDIAILTRTNGDANLITRACERNGIPCRFLSMRGLYQKDIILDVISYFKLLDNYHENSAVYRTLNLPFISISPKDIAKMTQYGYRKSKSIYSILLDASSVPEISPATIKKTKKLSEMIESHALMSARKNVSEIFISFLKDSGYLEYLAKKDDIEGIDYINQFFDRIKKFEDSNHSVRLRDFMEELNMEIDSGESGDLDSGLNDEKSVKIMTVHSAKGLEFKNVIISNLVDRKFPSDEKNNSLEIPFKLSNENNSKDDHLREERRLFYVAMTRAMDGLFFTSADDYGGVRRKKISRFLFELGFNNKNTTETKTIEIKKNTQKKNFSPNPPNHLSFTQIAAFSRCPLQYKFAHVLKIPVRERASHVFGKSMHSAVFKIMRALIEKEIDLLKALEIYDSCWIDEWYESRKQRIEYYNSGKKAIKMMFKNFKKYPPSVAQIEGKPVLEQGFIFNLRGHLLKGKIDRIDLTDNGFEIIDYKTGTFKPKLRSEDKEQLIIYQMAAKKSFGFDVRKMTYYYLEEGKKVSFESSEKEKQKFVEKFVEKANLIRKKMFDPNPGWHCASCDFINICEYAQKK